MAAVLVGAGLLYLAGLLVLVGYLGWRIVAGALLVLVLLSPSAVLAQEKNEDEGALFRALGYGTYATFGGDAVSTELALANGSSELNPFQDIRAVRIGSHVAVPVLVNYATAELYHNGHKKTALWVRIATVAAFGYATAHNLRQATR